MSGDFRCILCQCSFNSKDEITIHLRTHIKNNHGRSRNIRSTVNKSFACTKTTNIDPSKRPNLLHCLQTNINDERTPSYDNFVCKSEPVEADNLSQSSDDCLKVNGFLNQSMTEGDGPVNIPEVRLNMMKFKYIKTSKSPCVDERNRIMHLKQVKNLDSESADVQSVSCTTESLDTLAGEEEEVYLLPDNCNLKGTPAFTDEHSAIPDFLPENTAYHYEDMEDNLQASRSSGSVLEEGNEFIKCLPLVSHGSEAVPVSDLDNNQVTCSRCGQLVKIGQFSEHTGKHINCSKCTFVFTSKANLNYHFEMFHSDRQFVCTLCNHSFKQKMGLMRHFCVTPEDVANGHVCVNRCEICNKFFFMPKNLRQHYRKRHPSYEASHLCLICWIPFQKSSDLKTHLSLHESVLKCNHCDDRFQLRTSLIKHYSKKHSYLMTGLNEFEQLKMHDANCRCGFCMQVEEKLISSVPVTETHCQVELHPSILNYINDNTNVQLPFHLEQSHSLEQSRHRRSTRNLGQTFCVNRFKARENVSTLVAPSRDNESTHSESTCMKLNLIKQECDDTNDFLEHEGSQPSYVLQKNLTEYTLPKEAKRVHRESHTELLIKSECTETRNSDSEDLSIDFESVCQVLPSNVKTEDNQCINRNEECINMGSNQTNDLEGSETDCDLNLSSNAPQTRSKRGTYYSDSDESSTDSESVREKCLDILHDGKESSSSCDFQNLDPTSENQFLDMQAIIQKTKDIRKRVNAKSKRGWGTKIIELKKEIKAAKIQCSSIKELCGEKSRRVALPVCDIDFLSIAATTDTSVKYRKKGEPEIRKWPCKISRKTRSDDIKNKGSVNRHSPGNKLNDSDGCINRNEECVNMRNDVNQIGDLEGSDTDCESSLYSNTPQTNSDKASNYSDSDENSTDSESEDREKSLDISDDEKEESSSTCDLQHSNRELSKNKLLNIKTIIPKKLRTNRSQQSQTKLIPLKKELKAAKTPCLNKKKRCGKKSRNVALPVCDIDFLSTASTINIAINYQEKGQPEIRKRSRKTDCKTRCAFNKNNVNHQSRSNKSNDSEAENVSTASEASITKEVKIILVPCAQDYDTSNQFTSSGHLSRKRRMHLGDHDSLICPESELSRSKKDMKIKTVKHPTRRQKSGSCKHNKLGQEEINVPIKPDAVNSDESDALDKNENSLTIGKTSVPRSKHKYLPEEVHRTVLNNTAEGNENCFGNICEHLFVESDEKRTFIEACVPLSGPNNKININNGMNVCLLCGKEFVTACDLKHHLAKRLQVQRKHKNVKLLCLM